jgi:Ca-activated chloride channel family protein
MFTIPTLADRDLDILEDVEKTTAGFGALRTERGALPLVALDVHARLEGLIAGIEVRQTFVNNHDDPLEATYIFPLPDRAAVTRFRLEVAGRVVEGELQERGKARRQYDQAIRAGHRSAIAEEERPGVFTMRVGNLPPGEEALVSLSLVGPMPFRDGEVTFRFPLVVAPRYIPGVPLPRSSVGAGTSLDTDVVPDASRISPPVLLPGFSSPIQLRIAVEVPESPLTPHDFRSSLHAVVEEAKETGRRFHVQPGEKLDRDFILRYRLGSDRLQTSLVVQPDAKGEEGTFLLTIVPPTGREQKPCPREIVFVLDRSGSMDGWKMVAARRAVERMVETLTEQDRFTIYAFDDCIETPTGFDGLVLMPATDRQRFRAAEFLGRIEARNGTEMAEPLARAVEELMRSNDKVVERILVLITDGQIGNEDQLLKQIGSQARNIRIFTLGIDRAVNAAFLRRLADLGGGTSEVVESEARLDQVMDQIHRHLGTPVLTGLELQSSSLNLQKDTLVPARLPDLFVGNPVLISGRYRGQPTGTIVLRASEAHERSWSAELQTWRSDGAPLAQIWGRGRVRELEDRYVVDGDRAKIEHEIVETSLRCGVLSRFTAYVAVDRSEIVNAGGQQKQVTQAVEQPAGWGQPDGYAPQSPPMAAGGLMRSAAYRLKAPLTAGAIPAEAFHEDAERLGEPTKGMPRWDHCIPASPPGYTGEAVDADLVDDLDDDATTSTGEGGLVSRLFGAIFGGREKQKDASAKSLRMLDRSACRPHAEDLLGRLRAADHSTHLAALEAVVDDLERLVQALTRAGDKDRSVEKLVALSAIVHKLLAEQTKDGAVVDACYNDLIQALEEWLKQEPTPSGETFWK